MALVPGTRLGPYEIVAPLGAGGMGEVYRARDTRLERPVAVKILPLHLADRAEARERFEREAHAVSSLNHPHICQLYDIGEQNGVSYLVMEMLEGETLAFRLLRGPLPIEQVLRYGAEIADGLERAHRTGVVHRDLKPGNIMLTKSGAKLMDFGLAKEVSLPRPSSGLAVTINVSPSEPSGPSAGSRRREGSAPLTGEGVIVGTFHYMSPEQIEGKDADSRSDIFALGVVLYEMTTGRRAFEGKTMASIAAAVIASEPKPVSSIQPMVPPGLEHVIQLCLAKDPDERWQSALDLQRELKWIQEAGSQAGTASPIMVRRRRRVRLAWSVGVLLALLAGWAGGVFLRPTKKAPSLSVALNLPVGFRLDTQNASLALSPDGQKLAFAASGADGVQRLWLRSLNGQEPQAMTGTEDAIYPFWSPDNKYVGFFAGKKLKKIEVATGAMQTLCDAPAARGGTWNHQGEIVFAPDYQTGLYQVSASGGSAIAVTNGDKKFSHRLPHFLPDGRHVLFFSGWETHAKDNGIFSLDLDTKKVKPIASEQSEGLYVPPGYLVFLRGGNLMAQPFDAENQTTTGEALLIAENVVHNPDRFTGEFTFSDHGMQMYQTGPSISKSQLTIYDAEGGRIGAIGEAKAFQPEVFLSPDDRKVAVATRDPEGRSVLWVHDLSNGVGTRLTFGNLSYLDPVWSADGKRLAFDADNGNVLVQASDGSSPAQTVLSEASPKSTNAWSPDGRFLAMQQQMDKGPDLWLLPLAGDRKPVPFVSSPTWEAEGTFSPNGKWFAYSSDETGRYEVYVVPFTGTGGKLQVSSGGGQMPEWLNGGRQLAYINDTHNLVLVEMNDKQERMEIGRSRLLFGGHALPVLPGFDASAESGTPVYLTQDGKRIVLIVPTDFGSITALTLVTNWTAGFSR
jgi:eukaryotic-like serine/threonine-protein kinase